MNDIDIYELEQLQKDATLNLKKSVRSFEDFDLAFAQFKGKTYEQLEAEMAESNEFESINMQRMAQIEAKLYTEDFFSLERDGS